MWKKGKMLAVCMFAMAWWSVFYPELCFTEETCEVVQTAKAEEEAGPGVIPRGGEAGTSAQGSEDDTASGILWAGDDEVVISSRLLEWCGERLFDRKE